MHNNVGFWWWFYDTKGVHVMLSQCPISCASEISQVLSPMHFQQSLLYNNVLLPCLLIVLLYMQSIRISSITVAEMMSAKLWKTLATRELKGLTKPSALRFYLPAKYGISMLQLLSFTSSSRGWRTCMKNLWCAHSTSSRIKYLIEVSFDSDLHLHASQCWIKVKLKWKPVKVW